jgi:putative transposase
MARMPRLVVPGYPHHVTQRGNRRMKTFFCKEDYQYYRELLSEHKKDVGIEFWAYCLMPNHVHLVVVPEYKDSLSRLFRLVHRQYSRHINFRENWRGHLWQERFHSFVMDEEYLLSTVRYTELNPVRARLCNLAQDWRWSSTQAHFQGKDDLVVSVKPMLDRIDNWAAYLSCDEQPERMAKIRQHAGTGRSVGDDSFITFLELQTGRDLKKCKPGPKARIK